MTSSFHWADYLLCGVSLLLSVAIGVFYGIKDRKRDTNTAEEFLVAGRNLKILPVSLSIFVSWLSAISFIGDPVEVYYHGAVYTFLGIGYCTALPFIAHFFAPVINNMKLISVYAFLETRYNRAVRILVSSVSIVSSSLYLAVVIYAPSVALSQVTGIKEWISIVLIGSVGTFYTALGGIKAVVWADALQSLIMFIGVIAVIIQGLINVGGIQTVWEIAQRGGRLNFLQNSWSPFVRSTAWAYFIGGFARVFLPYISMQGIIQRYFALPSGRAATIAIYLNLPMYAVFSCTFTLIGLTMYAYYEGCDPLEMGRINRPDQLIPLFMLDTLGFLPGLSGVFLASLFAASLSSISSMLNSAATNIAKDFVEPYYLKRNGSVLSDKRMTCIAKYTSLFLGVFITCLAFATLYVKVNVFPLTNRITGLMVGPIGAMFICGMYATYVKTWHILMASTVGFTVCLWLGIGAFIYPPPSESLTTFGDVCLNNYTNDRIFMGITNTTWGITEENGALVTSWGITDENVTLTTDDNSSQLYNLSFLLYSVLGCVLTLLTAGILAVVQRGFNILTHQRTGKFTLVSTNDDKNGII